MAEIITPSLCLLLKGLPTEDFHTGDAVEFSGYTLKTPAISLVSLSSLMFKSIARQCDLVILSAEYFHDESVSVVRKSINAIGEARAHGCTIIIVGLKEDRIEESIRESAVTYLKEFALFTPTIRRAIDSAAEMINVKAQQEAEKIDDLVEEGRHVRVGDEAVVLKTKDFTYNLPVMSSVAVPHPFDVETLDDKLRFILGYSEDQVAVCGITRDPNEETMFGYVVPEATLDLPRGWREKWNSGVLFAGAIAIKTEGWTFAWPSMESEPSLMVIGGIDYQINGKCVVQRTPYCLCVLVDPEEISDGVV
jgi:hypothetical protein